MYHFWITYGHHAEGDVLRTHIISTFNFVDLISLGHNNAVMLEYDSIGIDADLKERSDTVLRLIRICAK